MHLAQLMVAKHFFLMYAIFVTMLYSAQVFEGHPFIVEAGVSVGGKDVKQVSAFWRIKMITSLLF